ncbi:MAG: Fe-Mn family superoxide dismutase [bacterium]|nr:Fe-Mn family superoxide dismutase [bacterium]
MFTEQKFNIPKLKGISEKTIEEHLKLYAGYVKHANLILAKIPEYLGYEKEDAFAPYAVSEIQRRFGFEFNGMRNHEVYFRSLEDGAAPLTSQSTLHGTLVKQWNSFENWISEFKQTAKTRGIGWACLYLDPVSGQLLNAWVDEQHFGQLQNCPLILGLDMWEHSYVADYAPSGKGQYIEDFFENLNWNIIENNFSEAVK